MEEIVGFRMCFIFVPNAEGYGTECLQIRVRNLDGSDTGSWRRATPFSLFMLEDSPQNLPVIDIWTDCRAADLDWLNESLEVALAADGVESEDCIRILTQEELNECVTRGEI